MNVTFDTNCIIALEKGERTARDLRRIVDSATKQRLNLRVVAISASEQPRAETEAGILEFEAKLARAGLAGVEILAPLAICPQFEEPVAQPRHLGAGTGGARRAQPEFLHQHVGGGGEQHAQLIGPEATAARAVDL